MPSPSKLWEDGIVELDWGRDEVGRSEEEGEFKPERGYAAGSDER
jgi:hypothetical protein